MTYDRTGQLDDHCWVTFMGRNWGIVARRRDLILLVDENSETCVLDTSGVDWDTYNVAAIEMLREQVVA